MDPLFIEQPKFEKVARRILDQDATKWTKQILDEFFTEFPYFMSENVNMEYKKKDETKGYAVATLSIGELAVPVIVTNYQLSPFDVCYKDGVTLPLTEETLGALANTNSAFKGVVQPERSDGQLDMLFQRSLVDLQPTAGMGKSASVIDRISDTITQEHKNDLLAALSNNEVAAGFELNGTVEVLAKIANVTPRPATYFKDSLSKVLTRDIHYLQKEGRFKYILTEGNSEVFDPVVTELTAGQAEQYEPIKAIGHDIEKKAVFTSTKGAAFEIDGTHDKLVLMNVDGIRKHAMADMTTSSEAQCDTTFGGEMPQMNDYGTWTHGNKAMMPFEIVGMIKSAGHYEINGFNGTSAETYIPLRSVDAVTPHEEYDNTYYVPTSYKFVKVGESTDIERDGTHREEIEANYYTKDSVGLYSLQGPTFNKYAQLGPNTHSMTHDEACYAALQCGASEASIIKMASAPTNVRIPFGSDLNCPTPLNKTAELLQAEYGAHSATIKAIATDLVKEAATLSDATAVDAVLALNMITKENILEFVHQLPLYEQVLSDLAKLLLTVRLGLPTVPEMAVERAMKGLSKVVEVLRGMSKLSKVKS